ncbi:MAG: hypothetical protein K8R55_01795, partial [Desulfuromonadaceae bacterium]|nr:hypothetical protein [Desulfuromonadaceae bacterium]
MEIIICGPAQQRPAIDINKEIRTYDKAVGAHCYGSRLGRSGGDFRSVQSWSAGRKGGAPPRGKDHRCGTQNRDRRGT